MLRKQLAAAEEADDKAATIELGRRLVAIAPNDSETWGQIAQLQLNEKNYDDCERTLNAWAKAVKQPPPAFHNVRGQVAFERKDYGAAERDFLAAVAKQSSGQLAADAFSNLAEVCIVQSRWIEVEKYRAKAIAAKDSASGHVEHATSLLRLHRWDAAYAEMAKANKIDSVDATVKEWLPQFERLQTFLPRIKSLETRIAKSPNDADLLLQRARLLTVAERPLLALEDCERAMKLQPAWMRARIQTGEARLDTEDADGAAKLQVSHDLTRVQDRHVADEPLHELADEDARCLREPDSAEPLAARSKTLRKLLQFTLALADAQAALVLDDESAAAHFEAAHSLDELGHGKEALAEIVRATELNPQDPVAWFYRGLLEGQRADLAGAIESQTKSLAIRESVVALREREQCARRMGKAKEADVDLARIRQLEPPPQ
ncbi:MAG: hypothetical protein QOG48_2252 [Verrucomicrobiota bacterium]|jgi:tetratricopeptide (TPR) repeat protein